MDVQLIQSHDAELKNLELCNVIKLSIKKSMMKKQKMKFNLGIDFESQIFKNDLILIKGGKNQKKEKNPECCTNDNCPVNNNAGCGCTVNNQVTCASIFRSRL